MSPPLDSSSPLDSSPPLNWNSRHLTRGWQKGVTAFYYGLGFDEQDLDRAQVGIGTPLLDGNLCNLHAYELARELAEGWCCREERDTRCDDQSAGREAGYHRS